MGLSASPEVVCDLIGSLYDAAADDGLWPEIAGRISRLLHANSSLLQLHTTAGASLLAAHGAAQSYISPEYEAYYWSRDVWVQGGASAGLRRVVTSRDIIPDSQFEATEFYNDCCKKLDIFYIVGLVFPIAKDQFGAMGVHRPRAAGDYCPDDVSLLASIAPHVERALRLRGRLIADDIDRQLGHVTAMRDAVVVVNREATVRYASPAADSILQCQDSLSCRRGRLALWDGPLEKQLLKIIRGAADRQPGCHDAWGLSFGVPRGENRLPLQLTIVPLCPSGSQINPSDPGAAIYIRDPEKIQGAEYLREEYGLTSTESRISIALAEGLSIHEIACQAGISPHTVRTHLKSVFAKTRTNRQAQLVALMLQRQC